MKLVLHVLGASDGVVDHTYSSTMEELIAFTPGLWSSQSHLLQYRGVIDHTYFSTCGELHFIFLVRRNGKTTARFELTELRSGRSTTMNFVGQVKDFVSVLSS